MNITIVAIGTRGDVQPAVALGKALKNVGHTVKIIASLNFEGWIAGHGLIPIATPIDMQAVMEGKHGVEWVEKGHNPLVQARLMKQMMDDMGWEMAWHTWEACQDAEVIISSFTTDALVTSMAEKLGVPQISMPLQPPLTATKDGRVGLSAPFPKRTSRLNRWFGKAMIEPFGWRVGGQLIQQLREELRLPPQTMRQNRAVLNGLLTLNAYSPHVVPHAADWPQNIHTVGYWFLAEENGWQPPQPLLDFLRAGAPPVYVGFGSMTQRNAEATTKLILQAVAQTGQRVLLSSGWAGLGEVDLPDSVFPLSSAPHGWLFEQVAAVVHHGGAGTTAAGLRAGRPTFIIPHMADQFFWGRRIDDLGVGPRPVPRHKLTANKLAAGLMAAVSDPKLSQKAAVLGQAIRQEDGLGKAVRLIEKSLQ